MLRINGEKYVSALTETLKLLESSGIKVKINTVLTKTISVKNYIGRSVL